MGPFFPLCCAYDPMCLKSSPVGIAGLIPLYAWFRAGPDPWPPSYLD